MGAPCHRMPQRVSTATVAPPRMAGKWTVGQGVLGAFPVAVFLHATVAQQLAENATGLHTGEWLGAPSHRAWRHACPPLPLSRGWRGSGPSEIQSRAPRRPWAAGGRNLFQEAGSISGGLFFQGAGSNSSISGAGSISGRLFYFISLFQGSTMAGASSRRSGDVRTRPTGRARARSTSLREDAPPAPPSPSPDEGVHAVMH